MRTLLRTGRGLVAAGALVLSLLPFVFVGPTVLRAYQQFGRRHESGPLPAPTVRFSPAQVARFRPLPVSPGSVPVLAYRGISDHPDGSSVDQATFAAQLAMLHRAGFTALSVEDYVRFVHGETTGLPPRPILITFDDGRLDAYRGADRVLQREGMRATMYVSTGDIGTDSERLTWKELHGMVASGRWEVQPQGDLGRSSVQYDAAGRTGPFYAFRRWSPKTGLESLADWEQRVTQDVFDAREKLRRQGWASPTFAVPYGAFGQSATNDPRIHGVFGGLLSRQFDAVFVQAAGNDPEWSVAHPAGGRVARLEIHAPMTADSLYGWLEKHDPVAQAARERAAAERAARAQAARRAAAARKQRQRQRRRARARAHRSRR